MSANMTLRVITFQDGDTWMAQALEHDICVQAPDFETLRERFEIIMELELLESEKRGDVEPLAGLTPAPDSFQELWDITETNHLVSQFQVDGLAVTMASAA